MLETILGGALSGASFILFYYIGKGLVYLGYGKKGSAAMKELEDGLPKGIGIFFAVLSFIWVFFGVMFYIWFHDNSADAGISLAIIIACPVIYGLWFVNARSKVPQLLRELEKVQSLRDGDQKNAAPGAQDLGYVPQRASQPGDWQCPCGRVNPKYISTCACGVNRRDVVEQ